MRTGPFLLVTALLVAPIAEAFAADVAENPSSRDHTWTYKSSYLDKDIVVLPGVFSPFEAEVQMLPFMSENQGLFRGKRVLEIGTGSGIISVYAAVLGAKKVVGTDIAENAVASLEQNAKRFGVAKRVKARLVPPTDMSAYSVIEPDEEFDVIISNPPYSLDLDATENSAVVDTGDLGFSIVRGFKEHLAPEGTAILYYGSLFYHLAMVKFARYSGYEVAHHRPWRLYAWEAGPLFNTYLGRLLQSEDLPRDAFRFDLEEPDTVQWLEVNKHGRERRAPLLPGNSRRAYAGMIVVRRPGAAAEPGEAGANPAPSPPAPAPPTG
jgi:SAM-dependent methyltransferase